MQKITSDLPEQLLNCLSAVLSCEAKPSSDFFTQLFDWPALMALADSCKVKPLLAHFIRQNKEYIPNDIYIEAGNYLIRNTQRNLIITAELITVAKAFKEANIPFCLFKGSALATQLFGNLSLRLISDIDILARLQDRQQITGLLTTLGYSRTLNYGWQETFTKPSSAEIDIHWQLTSFPKFPFKLPAFDEMQDTIKYISLSQDFEAPTFSMHDNCIILALQFIRGCYEGKPSLKQACDLAKIINMLKPDEWLQVTSEVGSQKLTRPFFWSIELTEQFIKLDKKRDYSNQISPWLRRYVENILFRKHAGNLWDKIYIRHIIRRGVPSYFLLLPCFLWETCLCMWFYLIQPRFLKIRWRKNNA